MEQKVINYIKSIGIDMIDEANSGHPGIVLSAAPIMYSLYANHLRIDKNSLKSDGRDRFVLSAGHGSALLYSTLYMFGLSLSEDDLQNFRKKGFKTPGHPENFITDAVEMTTGPLGQGIAGAVGMAIAAKIKKLDYKVYVLCGDGDLMEGISYEALSLAGRLKLDNLILIYDSNDITLDGPLSKSFNENIQKRFEAIDFDYSLVEDGNDLVNLNEKIEHAKEMKLPSIIEVKTIIGEGTSVSGTNEAHGKPLSKEDVVSLKGSFEIESRFIVPSEIRKFAQEKLNSRSEILIDEEETINLDIDCKDLYSKEEEIRASGQKILSRLVENNHLIVGGSADLSSSTKAYVKSVGDFSVENREGRNIWYGVREHAMGTITNGLALSNLKPFCSTFLAFADYMKPAIRLSAIMNIPSVFIFTHDSIGIGADGPTHQPVEQLAMLRSTPNLNVFRPADIKEVEGAFKIAFASISPSAIVLSRGTVETQKLTNYKNVSKGAYIVRKEKTLHGIIIATGSEVSLAVNVANKLFEDKKIDLRVISMPCMEIFKNQTEKYKEKIMPSGYKKIVIEAGSSFGWEGFVYSSKYLINVNEYGVSSSPEEVLDYMGFSEEKIIEKIIKLI